MTVAYGSKRIILTTCFQDNSTIETVNLSDSQFVFYNQENNYYWYYDMYEAFQNCPNLTTVTNMPNEVTEMSNCFYNCPNLTYVDKLPSWSLYLNDTFNSCTNFAQTIKIPESALEIGGMFSGTAITQAPIIPESVYWMKGTFKNCTQLTGDILIKSRNIESAELCFDGTTLRKNVYIPFYNLTQLGTQQTTTYESFLAEGYDSNGTKNGVYLMDYDELANGKLLVRDYEYTTNEIDEVTLTKYIGIGGNIDLPVIEEM